MGLVVHRQELELRILHNAVAVAPVD
jgi:hypothetical protein